MKLIVGLGNPGRKYEGTRHNVGFAAVDLLAARHGAAGSRRAGRGPDGQMAGGEHAARQAADVHESQRPGGLDLLQFYKIEVRGPLVIVDEAQLELGRLRARPSGSSGGHNGLKSVIGVLGTDAFPRLRIGVGRGDTRRDLGDHVLARFEPAERPVIDEAVQRAADAAETFVREGIVAVMNGYNRKDDRTTDSEEI